MGQMPEPDWRTLAMTKLQRYGLNVLNPLELTWSMGDLETGVDSRVRRALDLINQCDAVLANLIKPSYGTAMEIFYAHRRGKMVTVIGQSPFSPWVLSHSQARFGDIDHALDFIIGEQPQVDPVSWCLQYEGLLAEHYEQFPPDGELDYRLLGGELPVLVLAPHATSFFREGEFQEPAAFTGSMAAVLNRLARCHSLMSFYCCVADPCWHLEAPMLRALADIVKNGQIGLVVLLLGSAWHESPGLHIGANGPDSVVLEDLANELRLRLSSIEPVVVDKYDCLAEPLVRFTAHELGVPLITIKMHKRYRMPRLQPEPFTQIVDSLRGFVEQVGVDLLRSIN